MIDSYGWVAIGLRALSASLILSIIIWQIRLLKPPVKNQWIRYIMLSLSLIMLGNYTQTLILNFYRQADGNLTSNARHFSLLANALSGLASTTLITILYRKNLDK